MMEKSSVVFFGSGPVASRSLELLTADFTIEAVITKPTTEQQMANCVPGVAVYAVGNKKELSNLMRSVHFKSKLGILIDFGIIVTQDVIDAFPQGIINSHFSLLPQWRGADPITFSILSGQSKTGVSLMLLRAGMDEGPLLAQATLDIAPDMTTPTLTARLIELSNDLIHATVAKYSAGNIKPTPQSDAEPSYSRKLTKDDGLIDWNKPADQIEREIRAYIAWPRSRTQLAGREVIVTSAKVAPGNAPPGQIEANGSHLFVACGKGRLEILQLQPAGKTSMSTKAFLAGYRQYL